MSKITKQLTPVYHNPKIRTEFRLDSENLKYSDMRLLNVLFNDVNGEPVERNSNGGFSEYIKNITLLSGNIQVDRCDMVDLLSCHRVNSVSNRVNTYKTRYLNFNEYSFLTRCADPSTTGQNNIDRVTPIQPVIGLMGYVDLKLYLLFLNSTPVFKFPDMRLIIEWSDLAKTAVSNEEPVLVYEEANDETQPRYTGGVFTSWEFDRIRIPAVPEGQSQDLKLRFNGFNGKRVNRMLLASTPETTPTPENGFLCSVAQKNEGYQIFWNNEPLYQQYITENLKSRLLLDTWGNKTQPFGQDLYHLNSYDQIVEGDLAIAHTQSWGGVDLRGLPITNLQLGYRRTGYDAGQSWTTDPLLLYLFGEVDKFLSFNDKGQVIISYL